MMVTSGLAAAAERLNVLFIAVDDLKPMLGCYGDTKVKSPNIDRLARHGMVFTNSHCQQAVCGPSRASLLTGLRPDTTKVWDLKTKMRDVNPDILTLPQHFKNNGYTTLNIGKIFDGRNCDGWRSQDKVSWSGGIPSERRGLYASKKLNAVKKGKLPAVVECVDAPDNMYQDGSRADAAAIRMKALLKEENPFFLAVGFIKPHLPFVAPKKYWDLYDRQDFKVHPVQGKAKGSPSFAYQDSLELRGGYEGIPEGPIPEAMQLELIHGYYACVSFVDAQVGKLLNVLEESGEMDNTVIVFWGDHGFHLGDHGMFCKHTNFEQATRSPLIISTPGARAKGKSSAAPVEFVDIFPTLCDVAGLETPKNLEGTSLVPILNDSEASVKLAAISQFPRRIDGKPYVRQVDGKAYMGYSYRSRRYRYTVWVQKNFRKGETGTITDRELYDYETDPMETVNQVDTPAYADVVRRFEKLHAGGWKALRSSKKVDW